MNRLKNSLRGYSPSATGDSLSPPAAPPPARLTRLSHALLAKSLAEALFVVALAVYFSYTNINPYFRGTVDAADKLAVAGWVVNAAAPGERVEVHLYLNGHFVSRRVADAPRPDVAAAGWSADVYHGFVFQLPPLPPHKSYEARVYAMHRTGDITRRTLQEFGGVKQFAVEADGENVSVPEVWWEGEGRR